MKRKLLYLTILSLIFANNVFAGTAQSDLKNKLQKKFPGTPITSAQEVKDIPGLVEMVVGGNKILYTNTQGNKIIIGHIFDPRTNLDLTQTRLNELNKFSWGELPKNDAFVVKKGNGSRVFAVFTDPECPFCHKLDDTLRNMTNYKMYVYLFPLSIHPGSKKLSQQIWCSSNRAKAFENWMEKGIKPKTKPTSCDTSAIERNVKFGFKHGISGTPTIIGHNGETHAGWYPKNLLENFLNKTSLVNK